jgi:TPR repeat protein
MYMIGSCYEHGFGTGQDSTKAFEWYNKSTEQGNSSATYHLGYCCHLGQGVDEDKTKAFEWYEQSALLGHSIYYMYGNNVRCCIILRKGSWCDERFEQSKRVVHQISRQTQRTTIC